MTEYRIDDLARESGVTTRNIRGYQERGLLPRPLRRGRVAIYTERHLADLRAINKLLGSGFTLKHVATFLADPLARVGEALDLPDLVNDRKWSRRPSEEMSLADLEDVFGPLDPATLDALVTARIIHRIDGADRFRAADRRILGNIARLSALGVDASTIIAVHGEFVDRLADAVGVLTAAMTAELGRRPDMTPDDLSVLRSIATENAYAALDRALDGY